MITKKKDVVGRVLDGIIEAKPCGLPKQLYRGIRNALDGHRDFIKALTILNRVVDLHRRRPLSRKQRLRVSRLKRRQTFLWLKRQQHFAKLEQ